MDTFKTAVILAGGMSSRMGFDKQLLKINGKYIMETLISNLKMEFEEIIISANKFYREYKGCKLVFDKLTSNGPLAGIHSSLYESSSRYVYFISCDMPNINLEYIRFMKNCIKDMKVDACVAKRFEGREHIEPFNGFYSKYLVEYIEKMVEQNKRSVKELIKTVNTFYIKEDMVEMYNKGIDMFSNINTKEDMYKLMCLLNKSTLER